MRQQAIDHLKKLIEGQRVRLTYRDEFGMTADKRTPVHLRIKETNVAEDLVTRGLASYVPSKTFERTFERPVRSAQSKAKKAKKGIWADSVAAKAADEPAAAATPPKEVTFVSELGSKHYFPADDPRVSSINKQRLIEYSSEKEAKRAGKRPAPQRKKASTGPATIEAARESFNKGQQYYVAAIESGNTTGRDKLYEDAFKN